MTNSILSVLAKDPQDTARYSKLLVADTSADNLRDYDTAYQAWESSVASTVLQEDTRLQQQKLEPASFDVIITTAGFGKKDLTELFEDMSGMLEDGGLALVLTSGNDASNA